MLPATEPLLDVPLSYEGYAAVGFILGLAGFIVIPDHGCVRLWRECLAENKPKSDYSGGSLPQKNEHHSRYCSSQRAPRDHLRRCMIGHFHSRPANERDKWTQDQKCWPEGQNEDHHGTCYHSHMDRDLPEQGHQQ